MSKGKIPEVIGMLPQVLGNINLEINELKIKTNHRFESIRNHLINLVKDHEAIKNRTQNLTITVKERYLKRES